MRIQTIGYIREIATAEPTNGAADTINGHLGDDMILGGNGTDTITGDENDDVVFGDHGRLVFIAGTTDLTTLHLIESIDTLYGAADTISTQVGDDIVVGGAAGDTIDTGVGASVVFGDHGRLLGIEGAGPNRPIDTRTPVDAFQIPTFARIETINPAPGLGGNEHGGADTITTGPDRDIVFGGAAGDTITTNVGETLARPDGNNVVVGDYGFLSWVESYNPSPISLDWVRTTDEAFGGADTITTGTRHDFVFGGNAGDVINAGTGENIVFGDYGRITGIESTVFNRPIPSRSPATHPTTTRSPYSSWSRATPRPGASSVAPTRSRPAWAVTWSSVGLRVT